MCLTCVTKPGAWIETLGDCAREESITIPEAVELVVEFARDKTDGFVSDHDRELIYVAIRRDGAALIETAERAIVQLRALLPVAPDTAEGAIQ